MPHVARKKYLYKYVPYQAITNCKCKSIYLLFIGYEIEFRA